MRPLERRDLFAVLLLLVPLGCLLPAVFWSLRWPLVGDASLMHYVVFLMAKGWVPYRDIVDINLPGTYLLEAAAMRLLGTGALAWRTYDLGLLALSAVAMQWIAGRRGAVPAGIAAALFALIHLQDGLAQAGQRDLAVAVLLLWAYAALFRAQRAARLGGVLMFAACFPIGVTLTIKPTFLPLGLALLLLSARRRKQLGTSYARHFACGLAGLALPPLIAALWLARMGALRAFLHSAATLIPFHASLGHKPLAFLLAHALSPFGIVVVCWLVVVALTRPSQTLERLELLAGIGFALLAYVEQGKGYPYHRYPLLALLLVAMETDFLEALQRAGRTRYLAAAVLLLQCFILAPLMVRSFDRSTPFQDALAADLGTLGPGLSGNVQCLDTFGGCINTLYNLRLEPSSGYLYDCYLFTPRQNAVSAAYREGFWRAYMARPPRVLVLTDQYCFDGQKSFDRLDAWPLLAGELRRNYALTTDWHTSQRQRWWARPEETPRFRVYVRK